MVELTVMSFLYLGSEQSSARTARRASFLSRHLQTSLSPLQSPIKPNVFRMPSILVQIRRMDPSIKTAPMLTVVSVRLLDHTLDGIIDVVGLFFFNGLGLFNFNVTVTKLKKRRGNLLFVVGHLV